MNGCEYARFITVYLCFYLIDEGSWSSSCKDLQPGQIPSALFDSHSKSESCQNLFNISEELEVCQ